MKTVERTFYMTIGRRRSWRYQLSTPKITINKPSVPKGHIALKFKLQVPESLFTEFIPSGTITLPEDASIGRPAIEVEVPEGLTLTPDVRLRLVEYQDPEAPHE